MIERKLFGKKIDSFSCPDGPIFIIGHWRTGTTLLHQLMNLDPNLAAPTLFQVAEPIALSVHTCIMYLFFQPWLVNTGRWIM